MKSIKISCAVFSIIICLCMAASVVLAQEEKLDETLKTNGNGGKTDVGTWYMTYNNNRMWSNNFGKGKSIQYRALVSRDPDTYGIADSANIEEIDMHIAMLAEAKFDFIVYDLTNGGLTKDLAYGTGNEWIVENAKLTCQRLAVWNSSHEWKIRYAVAVGTYDQIRQGKPIGYTAEVQAKAVYDDFFMNEEYGHDHYYQLDGKPLLILYDFARNAAEEWQYYHGDRTYGDQFTVRAAQSGELGTYGWQTNYGSVLNDEVEAICPGWTTADGKGVIPRENGAYYQRNWDFILDNKLPRIVMIMAFNDFNEHLAIMPADSSGCNDSNEEIWRDQTGQINNTMYWDMTVESIRQIRIKNGELPKDNWYLINWMLTDPGTVTAFGLIIAIISTIIIVYKLKHLRKKVRE